MSAARFNEDLPMLKPGDRVSRALSAARLNGMTKLAQEAAMGSHIRGGPGVMVRSGPHGTTIRVQQPRARRVAAPPLPFNIVAGKVYPALVGGKMPTLGGQPLNTTSNVLATTGDFEVYFTLTFTVSYTETYLASWTLNTVTVNTGSSVPSDTDTVKYLHFNTVTGGVPVNSFFNSSIGILLGDAGANATRLIYFT